MNNETIVVFGEALVDDFITEQVVGGAPFNVARNLAALGALPLMITRLGNDGSGVTVSAEFGRFGMSQAGLQIDAARPTGRVVVERSAGGHRFIILPDQAYDYIEAGPALTAMAAVNPALLYFGTLAQRNPCSRDSLHQLFDACAGKTYLDLNLREGEVNEACVFDSLHQADIVKVNEEEVQNLFTCYLPEGAATQAIGSADWAAACDCLMRLFTLDELIVTLGERGSVYFGANGMRITTCDIVTTAHFVDTVGAGDAFSAVFLFGRSRQWPLQLILQRANAFAGAICGIAGAVPQDDAFYQSWIARWL